MRKRKLAEIARWGCPSTAASSDCRPGQGTDRKKLWSPSPCSVEGLDGQTSYCHEAVTGAFGWDTHAQNFTMVKSLSEVLDAGWASLMNDLKSRGLLDSTLIVWMGEFGRTPTINGARGRDHYPNAWSTVLAGGGIKGGQVVGKTS